MVKTESENRTRAFRRTLVHIPIVHTETDMGGLSGQARGLALRVLGVKGWRLKSKAVERMWVEIEQAIEGCGFSYQNVRLYQDGLPVCGREIEIVAELADKGSRNHRLLLQLIEKGASLMGTESTELLLDEYKRAKEAAAAQRAPRPLGTLHPDSSSSASLLESRDRFIASRINATLRDGETGVLFLGMLHSLDGLLDEDIRVLYPVRLGNLPIAKGAGKMSEQEAKVLIADDEEAHCSMLSRLMRREGFEVLAVNDGKAALDSIASAEPDVLLLDFVMPDMDGMRVLTLARQRYPSLPVIMITGYADIAGAVEAMRAGAHDYLAKPFDHYGVVRAVRRALSERRLREKVKRLSSREQDSCSLRDVMGPSDAVGRLISDVNLVARSDFSVLILGETGSGKELVARAIHRGSPRKGPFVAVDSGSIPETLLESELFGHEKGAFTGAVAYKPGKFEIARGGTLFLDEISNMPMASQAKLLRAIQEKKAYPVGARQPITVDVRLLAACNADLLELTKTGAFRLDLFFRLNEFCITIPPLRERKEDIPYLASLFLEATNRELNKNIKGFCGAAIEKLHAHDWPGNVRQLRSVIRRAVLMADEIISEAHLEITDPGVPIPDMARETAAAGWKETPLRELVQQGAAAIERGILIEALKHTGGNKAKAARMLKVDYKTMFSKVKQYGIQTDGGAHGTRKKSG